MTDPSDAAAAAMAPDRRLPENYPPALYVPCIERVERPEDVRLRYQQTQDGRRALLVYSALDRLQTCCGADQPWVLMPTSLLEDLHDADPFDVVYMDLFVPEDKRAGLRA